MNDTPIGGSVMGWLGAGGPVVALLVVMSVVALAVVLLKLWQLARLRPWSSAPEQALDAWSRGERGRALAVLERDPGPPARVLRAAMAGQQLGADEALVREEAARVASREFGALRGQLRLLELVGHLSPLLGLLGTVLGMIEAFQALEASGTRADPALLSGGIWEALLTTAVGLIVAVPALVALAWLEGVHERIMRRTEDVLTRLFTLPLARPAEAPARAAGRLAAAPA